MNSKVLMFCFFISLNLLYTSNRCIKKSISDAAAQSLRTYIARQVNGSVAHSLLEVSYPYHDYK